MIKKLNFKFKYNNFLNYIIFNYNGISFYFKIYKNYIISFYIDLINSYILYMYSLVNYQNLSLPEIKNIRDIIDVKNFSFVRLNIIGLGYKYFCYCGYIYLLIGLSHYILFKIPRDIYVCCRKKKIFLVSYNKKKLISFVNLVKFSKKPSVYKGKGIIEFPHFKNFVILKKGKKQQVS